MATMPIMDWGYGPADVLRENYAKERALIADTCHGDVTQTPFEAITGWAIRFDPAHPAGAPIVYFHGGGWVAGSPQTHITLCSWLAGLSNRQVISMPYGLAPEYKFPSQFHDAARALDDVLNTAQTCFVAGDSAGAAMAFWAESGAHKRANVLGIVSLYGAFGASDTASIAKFSDKSDGLSERDIRGMYERLGCPGGRAIADAISTQGAPALLITAGQDSLADDHRWLQAVKPNRAMTERVYADQAHAFLQFCGKDPVARSAMVDVATWMSDIDPN